jgi:hypothetical protein
MSRGGLGIFTSETNATLKSNLYMLDTERALASRLMKYHTLPNNTCEPTSPGMTQDNLPPASLKLSRVLTAMLLSTDLVHF